MVTKKCRHRWDYNVGESYGYAQLSRFCGKCGEWERIAEDATKREQRIFQKHLKALARELRK